MQKLTAILQNSAEFNDPEIDSYIPIGQQAVYLKLAEKYQGAISHLYEDPEELHMSTQIGSSDLWEEFLNIEPVKLYTAVRTKNLSTVTARKSLKNLQLSANKGDVAAIKYLNDISGILQKQSDNKQIVMHYIPRPKRDKSKEVKQDESRG